MGTRTIDPFTGSKGYQGRTFEEELAGPHTIDPFQGNALARLRGYGQDVADYGAQLRLQNAPSVDTAMPAIVRVPIESVPRDMPVRTAANTGLGPRARPIFRNNSGLLPVTDFAAERQARTIPIPLYQGGDVRVAPSAMIGGKEVPALTPAQQEALDAQHDYLSDWTVVDEAGNRRLLDRPMSEMFPNFAPMPAGLMRSIAEVEAADREQAQIQEAARLAAKPMPPRRI